VLATTLLWCAVLCQEVPETVYVNGAVYTVDSAFSKAEAIAVKDGRIVAVGTTDDVKRLMGAATHTVDLKGRCVTPGLIDSHGHMAGLGSYASGRLDLHDAKSFDDVVKAVKAAVAKAKPGEWILGGRWDQSLWGQKEFPSHEKLSAVSPDNPVWLDRVDGHAGLANAAAMEVAKVTKQTPNPRGGEVLRDAGGNATGMFVDNATPLVERHIPGGKRTAADLILAAQEKCLAVGLTGVHDAGIGLAELEAYRAMAEDGRLRMRIYAMMGASLGAEYFRSHKPESGERFSARAIKCMIDGAMGSRGAWLLEDYADRPGHRGLPVQTPEFIASVCAAASEGGWQVCTHAIGDRGVRETLDVYERASKGNRRLRWRVEHAQCPAVEDIARFAKLGVIPSMQQTHATSDMRWAEARVGPERVKGAYAWRKFADAGCRIAGGSDFPVESENPLWGIYAGVTRQDHDGKPAGGWRPEERQTRQEALRSFTIDGAYAAFEEKEKGSLERGKMADFVAWSVDIVTCDPKELLAAVPVLVVIAGRTEVDKTSK